MRTLQLFSDHATTKVVLEKESFRIKAFARFATNVDACGRIYIHAANRSSQDILVFKRHSSKLRK